MYLQSHQPEALLGSVRGEGRVAETHPQLRALLHALENPDGIQRREEGSSAALVSPGTPGACSPTLTLLRSSLLPFSTELAQHSVRCAD